ncbi:MAG: DUF2442 domain-containing protein [Pyrinomonadaceae bacterium]|nr:DUF2442 domain-containing protein [Pyrinomonadaceae bacterium]
MKKVISAKANDDFTLDLEFNDGLNKRFDVKPYLDKGIFSELKNLDYFKNIKIAFGTVQWENEQDFAPATLYSESELSEAEFITN